jgi:hypothetical protein
MGTKLVSFSQSTLYQIGERIDVAFVDAIQEKGRAGIMFGEGVEHLSGVNERPVVEGECNSVWDVAVGDDKSIWEMGPLSLCSIEKVVCWDERNGGVWYHNC